MERLEAREARNRIIQRAEKELASLDLEEQAAQSIGYGGGCFPSSGSLGSARDRVNCCSPAPTSQGEVTSLADAIYERAETLHRELTSVEGRFASILRPPDPQNKTGPSAPVMTTLGGRLYDCLQSVNAAIARLQAIQELACL